jgi:hypothetical protein
MLNTFYVDKIYIISINIILINNVKNHYVLVFHQYVMFTDRRFESGNLFCVRVRPILTANRQFDDRGVMYHINSNVQ